MELETKPFATILADQAAAAQSAAAQRGIASGLLDFSVGSVFRALAEANAAVALWLQAQILRVLGTTRAATSAADDLDTWMADFGLSRSPAQRAKGLVTLSRFTPALPALVPVGTLVRTGDASRSFTVTADPLHSAWDATQSGYRVTAGTTSIQVPIEAATAGLSGNVTSGSVTLLASAVPGVDTATNAAALTGGTDAESDAAIRTRFHAYFASLSRATPEAIRFAVDQVQAGLSFAVIENQLPDGTPKPAYFQVIVDDGTGTPSGTLISAVAALVEHYRPVGVGFAVLGPVRFVANVTMAVTVEQGADEVAVVALVQTTVRDFINGLDLNEPLPFTRLAQSAYAASPLVRNVTDVLLNGATADIAAAPRRVIRAGTVSVVAT